MANYVGYGCASTIHVETQGVRGWGGGGWVRVRVDVHTHSAHSEKPACSAALLHEQVRTRRDTKVPSCLSAHGLTRLC